MKLELDTTAVRIAGCHLATGAAIVSLLSLGAACRQSSAPRVEPVARAEATSAVQPAQAAPPQQPRTLDATRSRRARLPEDPVAAKRATQQWQRHLEHEEEERQALFDRQRLTQHRQVVKLLLAARARYDGARNAAMVQRASRRMPTEISKIRKQITRIDHWGNNSRLLPDYDAMLDLLSDAYADAKIASLRGQPDRLGELQSSFDQHNRAVERWLDEVEHFEDE